jgi:hypothetical protein
MSYAVTTLQCIQQMSGCTYPEHIHRIIIPNKEINGLNMYPKERIPLDYSNRMTRHIFERKLK